jgi:Cu/Ag efflux protein CusF
MNRNSILIAISILGAGFAFQAAAADSHDHSHAATSAAKPAAAASGALIDGEVRKIDKAADKITLKHGAVPRFDMPPMTMVYRVKDKAMLGELKLGDKVKFDLDSAGGEITVLRAEKAK